TMLRWLLVLLSLPTQALARGGSSYYCGAACHHSSRSFLTALILGAVVLVALGYGLWHILLFFNPQKSNPHESNDKPVDLAAKGVLGVLVSGGIVIATEGAALGGVVIIVLFLVGLAIYNRGR